MWIRALDYMPPVHLEFGDTLSAALTADLEVRPDDKRLKLRDHLLEIVQGLRHRAGVDSERRRPGSGDPRRRVFDYDRVRFESMQRDKDEVFRFIWDNRDKLRAPRRARTRGAVGPPVRPHRRGRLHAARDGGRVLPGGASDRRGVPRRGTSSCRKRTSPRSGSRKTGRGAAIGVPLRGAADEAGAEGSDEDIGAMTPSTAAAC